MQMFADVSMSLWAGFLLDRTHPKDFQRSQAAHQQVQPSPQVLRRGGKKEVTWADDESEDEEEESLGF